MRHQTAGQYIFGITYLYQNSKVTMAKGTDKPFNPPHGAVLSQKKATFVGQ